MKTAIIATITTTAILLTGTAMSDNAAPAFSLQAVDGSTHSLEQYAGKIVVLEWTNYDCPFVGKFYSAGDMQKWQEKYNGKDVVWLSICSSAPGKQGHFSTDEWKKRIAEKKAKATAVLIDADGTVGRLYKATNTPHIYVISKDGKIAYQGSIDDKRSTSQADVAGARNYLTEALDALLKDGTVAVQETKAYGCSVKY